MAICLLLMSPGRLGGDAPKPHQTGPLTSVVSKIWLAKFQVGQPSLPLDHLSLPKKKYCIGPKVEFRLSTSCTPKNLMLLTLSTMVPSVINDMLLSVIPPEGGICTKLLAC